MSAPLRIGTPSRPVCRLDVQNEKHRGEWRRIFAIYGLPAFGNWIKPKGNTPVDGGAVLLALGPDEFLVAGHHVRVDFTPKFGQEDPSPKKRLFPVVQEGHFDGAGKWQTSRIWNGDQTDYGLNLQTEGTTLLRVKLGTY